MRNHLIVVSIGVLIGIAGVWWVQPDNNGGVVIIIVLAVLITQAISSIVSLFNKANAKRHRGIATKSRKRTLKSTSTKIQIAVIIFAPSIGAYSHYTYADQLDDNTQLNRCLTEYKTSCAARTDDSRCSELWRHCVELRSNTNSSSPAPHSPEPGVASPHPGIDRPDSPTVHGNPPGPPQIGPPRQPALPPPEPAVGPAHGLRPKARLTPARTFLPAAEIPPKDVAAYGVIALTAKQTPASASRLNMACTAYLASLPSVDEIEDVPKSEQMLTIWPLLPGMISSALLSERELMEAGADDTDKNRGRLCEIALGGYDLRGGSDAIRDAVASGYQLDGRGPFLIGWSPSKTRGVPDAVVLVVDMSDFESQTSFDDAFLFWQQKIIENPELWRSGFEIEKIRLSIKDFVDRYGESILAAIKLTSAK